MEFCYRGTASSSILLLAFVAFPLTPGTCADTMQSPVNITKAGTVYEPLPALQFSYGKNATLKVVNTGSPDMKRRFAPMSKPAREA